MHALLRLRVLWPRDDGSERRESKGPALPGLSLLQVLIRTGGAHYKQAPEDREHAVRAPRERRRRLAERGLL